MPSPADRRARGWRPVLERAARIGALLILAWLLWAAWGGAPAVPDESVDGRGLRAALERWSRGAAPGSVRVQLDQPFSAVDRDWLAAVAATGTRVRWAGAEAVPLAATADPLADPAGGAAVRVAAPDRRQVRVEDEYGALDSVVVEGGGAGFALRSSAGALAVRTGVLTASTALRDSLRLGRILLLGRVDWESKYVAAALEEEGWRLDVSLRLAPGRNVTQGAWVLPDTSRYAAVVVLDSVAASRDAAALLRYVRSGGGVILGPEGSGTGLTAGSAGRIVPGIEPFDTGMGGGRASLSYRPLRLGLAAVPLELRGADVVVAARREGRGRVAAFGYLDSWRWRLAGGADSPDRHRAWWADLVAAVAYAPATRLPRGRPLDQAPYAALVEALGPPRANGSEAPRAPNRLPVPPGAPAMWATVLAALLLGEWASRRSRGER